MHGFLFHVTSLRFAFGVDSSAFFHAQIEQPVRGLMGLFNQQDAPVVVAINERGVFIIDNINGVSIEMNRAN